MAQDDETLPMSVEEASEISCDVWGKLAEKIDEHVLGAEITGKHQVAELMIMAAQAEACRYRATGEDDAVQFDMLRSAAIR